MTPAPPAAAASQLEPADAADAGNTDADISPHIDKKKDILLYFYDPRDTFYTLYMLR